MAHRYFTQDIHGDEAFITGGDATHLAKVLRVKSGQVVTLCDGAGIDYEAEVVSAGADEVCLHVLTKAPSMAEPSVHAAVFIGMARGERMDYAVQKSVELGAAAIYPFYSEFCVVKPGKEENKQKRWQRIADEAAKQCGRGILPVVYPPLPFAAMLQKAAAEGAMLFFYERGGAPLREALGEGKRFSLIIGAEGGFSEAEAGAALAAGAVAVGLGARILRCETAPVAVLAALMTLTGNLE